MVFISSLLTWQGLQLIGITVSLGVSRATALDAILY